MEYRINYLKVDPRMQDDIVVEVLRDSGWMIVDSFNSLSDDYAYANARECLKSLQKHEP